MTDQALARKTETGVAKAANAEYNSYRMHEYRRQLKYRDMADTILLNRNAQREFYDRCTMVARAGAYGHKDANTVWIAAHFGMSMGMSFSQAIKRVKVIHGTPTLRGQAAINTIHERVQGAKCRVVNSSETSCTWRFERPGYETQEIAYTIEDAKRQGLTKNPNYAKFPQDMLMWQCATLGAKRMFGDVLDGLYVDEEMEKAIAEAERGNQDFDDFVAAEPSSPGAVEQVQSAAAISGEVDADKSAPAQKPAREEPVADAEYTEAPASQTEKSQDELAHEHASAALSEALTHACEWCNADNP